MATAWLAASGAVVFGCFVLVNGFQTLLLLSAAWSLRSHRRRAWGEDLHQLLGSEVLPTTSVLAPAYNEERTIIESVHALLGLRYPHLEVVVINDGSTDQTLALLIDAFELVPVHPALRQRFETRPVRATYRSRMHPALLVVDKDNGGKADALNAGLNVASGELVCALDADTLVEADGLLRMVRPFLADDRLAAVGGTIRVANGAAVRRGSVMALRVPRHPLAGIQTVEYLRAFLFGRLGWNRLGGNLIIPGAFGLFRRQAVFDAGGYNGATVGEDMELVAALRRRAAEGGGRARIGFAPDPVAWTEVPVTLHGLRRQRDRWHRGLADVLWRHRQVLGRPRYGALGLFVAPLFVVVELLAPVVEAVGLLTVGLALGLGAVEWSFAAALLCVAYGWAVLLSLLAIVLEEFSFGRVDGVAGRLLLVVWALVEPLGYRQLTVVWRLQGLVSWLRGSTEWGRMSRSGFLVADPSDLEAARPLREEDSVGTMQVPLV